MKSVTKRKYLSKYKYKINFDKTYHQLAVCNVTIPLHRPTIEMTTKNQKNIEEVKRK